MVSTFGKSALNQPSIRARPDGGNNWQLHEARMKHLSTLYPKLSVRLGRAEAALHLLTHHANPPALYLESLLTSLPTQLVPKCFWACIASISCKLNRGSSRSNPKGSAQDPRIQS